MLAFVDQTSGESRSTAGRTPNYGQRQACTKWPTLGIAVPHPSRAEDYGALVAPSHISANQMGRSANPGPLRLIRGVSCLRRVVTAVTIKNVACSITIDVGATDGDHDAAVLHSATVIVSVLVRNAVLGEHLVERPG